MERKIGEIFEYNGEWYQCLEEKYCNGCVFRDAKCDDARNILGNCSVRNRSDKKSVIFKKLEKVGEPYVAYGKVRQKYKLYIPLTITNGIIERDISCDDVHEIVDIKIKQTKEDMEDLDKIKVRDYTKVEELNVMEEKKLNLNPFDIQKAKEGKPVCTRDGRKARIICFDRDWDMHIVALVSDPIGESVYYYLSNGKVDFYKQNDEDLMMLPEKKEGWINVYRDCDGANITKDDNIYSSKEAAIASAQFIDRNSYVATTKINWEE